MSAETIFQCVDTDGDTLEVESSTLDDHAIFLVTPMEGVYLTDTEVDQLIGAIRPFGAAATEEIQPDYKYQAELLQKKFNDAIVQRDVERKRVGDLENKLVNVRRDVKREFAAQLDRRFDQLRRSLEYGDDGTCPGCKTCQE